MKKQILAAALCAMTLSAYAGTEVMNEFTRNGTTFQIVRDDAGHVFKQRKGAVRQAPAPAPAKEEQPTVETFYEGFEDYETEYGLNWIPENWTKVNTEANTPTPEQISHNINNSWYVYFSSDMYQDYTTDGEKEAFIHFAYDGSYGVVNAAQDEWLITPPIQLTSQETLHFILQSDFSEIYNFDYWSYSTYTYSQREIINNMKVMITTDDGENWDCIMDLEADYVKHHTDRELYEQNGVRLREYDVPLDAYDGKEVKIAFRYLREEIWGGNSMIVDGVSIDHPQGAGIADIATDADTPAEYYNLQGVRIAAPEAGNVCIRRTADKVEKIFVK